MRSAQTASVSLTPNAHGPMWTSQVRELDNKRTYLGRHKTKEDALAACARYIATGERPAPLKRGIKLGQKRRIDPPQLLPRNTPACPLPTAELLARIAAKHPLSRPAVPPLSDSATSDSAPARREAPVDPAERKAARLATIKRLASYYQ